MLSSIYFLDKSNVNTSLKTEEYGRAFFNSAKTAACGDI